MRRTLLVPLAMLVALLAACGTTEPSAPEPGQAAAGGPVTVTDARGKQVTLQAPATRVVGLEWNVVEHAVSLGVMPVGAADVEGYGKWVTAEPLDASVRDVGVRGEPSIDTIASLRPDLILATDELPGSAVQQMERFAPVVFVKGGDAKDGLGQMRRNLDIVATTLGKQAEAATLLSEMDATIERGRTALAARAGQPFLFADGYLEGSQVSIRPFANGSMLSDVTTRLGMRNAWTEPGDGVYGLGQSDVEGLTRVGDATFLYIANDRDGGDPFATALAGNAVWKSLPFVKSGNVHRLPDGIWMFGGPTSVQRYVDAVVGTLRT
ncbi:iron-siderophore ABC transporter substrate-binding protein [Pseudonocardia endophytica]|uniref:Iron complex transport system substrate-binding protein n=1 Tax=Pseudonocardia endophytica TaxID=401976 RepID=A0A4R1HPA0_PSEEN|nr:iron-siderophore ABC transporter substrate-binding protein [Pseudonocardia endophytica]TCK21559.1 iron complex transport system substrate-binding protein [Pseudonocardia endophytica]